ncbi:endonuclease/exonuclease/phosphatase family protein [Streptomyces sp. TP-A0875]|uniref:endonuclease/exonuclease/phosphatase family protein n=1 Tax=Streptomyces sp. TP-A0875 TaxID=552354 RepID=UPI00131C6EBC|nr:endonuclease/exonuclease/phosphatase family protein [Streptomyces sp. TP-A0875]
MFCTAIAGLQIVLAPSAGAAEISADAEAVAKSAGQKWALKSLATGMYVSVGVNDTDTQQWRMRARAASVGSWERFTLHTNHRAKTVGFRSEITGFFATAEFHDSGNQEGMLRARGARLGQWQQFTPQYLAGPPPAGSPAGSVMVTLQASEEAGGELKYVSAEVGETGEGLLRARATSVGLWEKFVLEPVTGTISNEPPTAGAAPASLLNVMSWNVCANNNNDCGWSHERAGYLELNEQIKNRLKNPDVIFFQEFCEKHAKRVEWMLESETGTGWDVRFAPVHHATSGPLVQKECAMGPAPDLADRGSFGVAIAVPDENVWYKRHDLPSPDAATWEQRTALCASIPSRAVMVCNAHFSAGGKKNDDPDGDWRRKQARKMLEIGEQYRKKGYRVVFGGDFNSVPPDYTISDGPNNILVDTYEAYRECDEGLWAGSPRNGRATKPFPDREIKIDYIFAPNAAQFASCTVTSDAGKSDHYPIYGRVSLPGT